MRTIIAGSRNVSHAVGMGLVREAISASGWSGEISEVIHGAARGIDSAAGEALAGVWPITSVPAEWGIYGNSAGPIRNRKMAGMADALIAIWDGKSRGTKNMIDVAKSSGLKVFVFRIS